MLVWVVRRSRVSPDGLAAPRSDDMFLQAVEDYKHPSTCHEEVLALRGWALRPRSPQHGGITFEHDLFFF